MLPPLNMMHCYPYGSWCLDVTFFSFSVTLTVMFKMVSASRIPLLRVEARFVASNIWTSWSPTISTQAMCHISRVEKAGESVMLWTWYSPKACQKWHQGIWLLVSSYMRTSFLYHTWPSWMAQESAGIKFEGHVSFYFEGLWEIEPFNVDI